MTTKKIPPIPVIYFSTRATLRTISKHVGTVAEKLYVEAAKSGLLPTGPIQWIYIGADGRPDTEFTLEIALPIRGIVPPTASFPHKELPEFECASFLHHGEWDHLFETYDRAVDEVVASGKQLNGYCREQYVYMDFKSPVHNLTEVQLGI